MLVSLTLEEAKEISSLIGDAIRKDQRMDFLSNVKDDIDMLVKDAIK